MRESDDIEPHLKPLDHLRPLVEGDRFPIAFQGSYGEIVILASGGIAVQFQFDAPRQQRAFFTEIVGRYPPFQASLQTVFLDY